jgi:hypothetical protein
MVLLTGDPSGVPFFHRHRWMWPLLESERVVLLILVRAPNPYMRDGNRIVVERLADRFIRISLIS